MDMTRRNFLAAAGVAGAGAFATLAGCSAPAHRQKSSDASDGVVQDASAANVVETVDVDVVVVGSGTAGTYAAVRAAENGANVLWLEQNQVRGGTSAITEGIATIGGYAMREQGLDLKLDQLYHDFMEFQSWGASPEVLSMYLTNNGPATDWAIDHGAKLQYSPMSEDTYWGSVCFDDEGNFLHMGEGMLQPLWDYGDTMSNLELRTGVTASDLVMQDGTVTGLLAEGGKGTIQVNAKAVVLATGGFADNPDMMKQYVGAEEGEIVIVGMGGRMGTGVKMGLSAGGRMHGQSAMMYTFGAVEGASGFNDIVNMVFCWDATLSVNEKGERFFNEAATVNDRTDFRNLSVRNQKTAWAVADAPYVNGIAEMGQVDYVTGKTEGDLMQEIESYDSIVSAQTLDELAEKMGVPADALKASVEHYNAIADGEPDPRFGLTGEFAIPVLEAPYYAAKIVPSAYGTEGGPLTNDKMQVLSDETGEPIPGLYVVGSDNGSMYHTNYPMHIVGGTAQGFAAASGFVAANTITA